MKNVYHQAIFYETIMHKQYVLDLVNIWYDLLTIVGSDNISFG